VISPGTGLFCRRHSAGDRASLPGWAPRDSQRNLTPASGCQDHTTSPSATLPLVSHAPTTHELLRPCDLDSMHDSVASTASHPTFVTIREAPLLGRGGMRERKSHISEKRKRNIFARGLKDRITLNRLTKFHFACTRFLSFGSLGSEQASTKSARRANRFLTRCAPDETSQRARSKQIAARPAAISVLVRAGRLRARLGGTFRSREIAFYPAT
jgi:hypothetical protein